MQTKKKSLGFWTLISLVVGNVIGSGVFLLPSALAKYGSIGIVAWILTSLGAICLALVFAHLGGRYPKIGGPYAYCREAFGDFLGFQVAYNYWIAVWVGNAAIIVALVGYLSFIFPPLVHNHVLSFVTAVTILWVITAINVAGVRQAGFVQLVMTILKLVPLILIPCVGLFFIHPHYLAAFNISHHSNIGALTATATLAFWSFIGIESATVPADDIENPKRNIPRATIVGVLIAALIYIFGTVTIMGLIPMHTLANSASPFADAAYMLFGEWGALFIAFGAIVSTLGALNGWVLMQGQIPLAAARDDLFPAHFAKTAKSGTPAFGLVFSSILITLLLIMNFNKSLVSQFTIIILLATFASLIPYLYTAMAEIMLLIRDREAMNNKNFRKPLIIALLAFAYIFWAIIGSGERIVFFGALLLLSSAPVYVWMCSGRRKTGNGVEKEIR